MEARCIISQTVGNSEKIYPPLGKVTNTELLNKLKNTKEWVLDGLLAEEAEMLVTKAKENGIEIKLKK